MHHNPNRPPNCRIFLGNLASEKTSRKELQEIFSKYGEIVEEIVLRRSFGFIQYDNPVSAKNAMEGENGRLIGGIRVDISLADNREPRSKRQRSDRDRDREREDREKDKGKGYGARGDRKRGRFDEDARDRRAGRERSPSSRISGFSNGPPVVCQVVYINPAQRRYAESVRQMVQDQLNLSAETYYLDRMSVEDVLLRASRRSIRYVFVVGNQHERRSTVDCTLLVHGRPEVFKDVTTMEAIEMVGRSEGLLPPVGQQVPPPQQLPPQQLQQNLSGPPLSVDPALLLQVLAGQLTTPALSSVGPNGSLSSIGGGAAPFPVSTGRPPLQSGRVGASSVPGVGATSVNTNVLSSLQALIASLQQNVVGGGQALPPSPSPGVAILSNGTPTPSSLGNPSSQQVTSAALGLLTAQQPFPPVPTGVTDNNLSSLQALLSSSASFPSPQQQAPSSRSSSVQSTLPSVDGSQPYNLPYAQPQQYQGFTHPAPGILPTQQPPIPTNLLAFLAQSKGTTPAGQSLQNPPSFQAQSIPYTGLTKPQWGQK